MKNKVPYWLTDELIFRLKSVYRLALNDMRDNHYQLGDTWPAIATKQLDIHDALLSDDNAIADVLTNIGNTYLYFGMDFCHKDFLNLGPDSEVVKGMHSRIKNTLVRLAEALGVVRCWNPEAAHFSPKDYAKKEFDVEFLLSAIELKFKRNIFFPSPFDSEIGIMTSKGLLSFRAINALYQSFLLGSLSQDKCAILEIGAGMGRTAYFMKKTWGYDYSIVDLPMAIVGQAIFLSATLGSDSIWLRGEDQNLRCHRVRITTPTELFNSEETFDIVLNADSLTEMNRVEANRYLDLISERARVFVSINHEVNAFTVNEIAQWRHRSRSQYWLREGWVEEVFETSSSCHQ
jgi:hypothetical protein